MSSPSNTKRTYSTRDTPAEQWYRLYVDVRAGYGRAAIQAALFLNRALCRPASVSRQSRHRPPSQRRKRKLCGFQSCFVCFGIGVVLAASANVIALLIQNVAIAHPKEAECRFARRLRTTGIGMVVASLIPFAIGMTVAATHWRIWFGHWISPLERSLHRKPAGGRPYAARLCGCNRASRSQAFVG